MIQPVWLGEDPTSFPPTSLALTDPNGLLAVGGDLSPARLIAAYSKGIFPWFNDGQPILWWSPEPRMVFTPGDIHQSKSLKNYVKKTPCSVTLNCDFEAVIAHCRQPRAQQDGTWITDEMMEAYIELHYQGFAHSVETRAADGRLIGGFYGVGIGAVFFGESMFSLQSNASKIAITQFSQWAQEKCFAMIDCQVENPHLQTLGGNLISRRDFELVLKEHTTAKMDHFKDLWQTHTGSTIFSNVDTFNTAQD